MGTCPSARHLRVIVGTECGIRRGERSCCSALSSSVSPTDVLVCLCVLAESESMQQTDILIEDLIEIYGSCVGATPSLPRAGCAEGINHCYLLSAFLILHLSKN